MMEETPTPLTAVDLFCGLRGHVDGIRKCGI